MQSTLTPKIYISYSWAPASLEIVETIDLDLQGVGIRIIRDTRDLLFKDSLRKFMLSMSEGDYIIVVISKDYLYSPNCMFEAFNLFNEPKFSDKIIPFFALDANIYSPEGRLEYITYWTSRVEEIDKKLQALGNLPSLAGIHAKRKEYLQIRDFIDTFSDQITDMRGFSWPNSADLDYREKKAKGYKEVLEYIKYDNRHIIEEGLRILGLQDNNEQTTAYQNLASKYPNEKFTLSIGSTLAIQNKDYFGAKNILKKLLPIDPILAHIELGLLFETKLDEPTLAREQFELALALEPDNPRSHYNLALLLSGEGLYDAAREHYEAARDAYPYYADIHTNLGNLFAGVYKQYGRARKSLEQALKLAPEGAHIHHNMGLVLRDGFKDYSSARTHFEESIRLRPDNASTRYTLSKLLFEHFDERESTRVHYTEALRLEPSGRNPEIDRFLNL